MPANEPTHPKCMADVVAQQVQRATCWADSTLGFDSASSFQTSTEAESVVELMEYQSSAANQGARAPGGQGDGMLRRYKAPKRRKAGRTTSTPEGTPLG